MRFPFYLANRFIKSRKQTGVVSLVSLISIFGIGLGVAVVIISLTILDGFEKAVSEKIVNFDSHIYVSGFGKRDLPPMQEGLPLIEEMTGEYRDAITPFIQKYAILKAGNRSEGVQLVGIEPDAPNYNISGYVTEGNYSFRGKDLPGILVGKKLADKLFLKTGDKITIFALNREEPPSPQNPPVIKQFRVTGLYESGMAAYDDVNVYIDITTARNVFEMGETVSGYNIKLNELTYIDSLTESLQDTLGYPYYVRTVYREHQNIFTWIELQKKPIPIILGLIIIVAAFNIIGTLLMIVLERVTDIGTLKSMGAVKRQLTGIFVYQGMYLSVIGIAAGNILALVLSLVQDKWQIISLPSSVYFISAVPVSIDIFNYLLVSVIAFLVSMAASYIPGRYAAKLNPAEAIKFD